MMASDTPRENWVQVYEARDEWAASLVQQALQDAGIPSVVEPRSVSFFGGAVSSEPGVWADVMVQEERLADAEAVIAADTAQMDAPGPAEPEGLP